MAVKQKDLFETFGVEWQSIGRNNVGNCLFCDGDKFHASLTTHLWDCKTCGESGNQYGFIRGVYDKAIKETKIAHYKKLAKSRGIKYQTLSTLRWAYDELNNTWLIPHLNKEDALTNLYRAIKFKDKNTGQWKYRMFSCPEPFSQSLYIANLPDNYEEVWLLEGHWDTVMWHEVAALLDSEGNKKEADSDSDSLLERVAIMGVPGANSHCLKQLKTLIAGKPLYTLLDWDKKDRQGRRAGAIGTKKLAETTFNTCELHQYLNWESIDPPLDLREGEKVDVSDFVKMRTPVRAFQQILAALEDGVDLIDEEKRNKLGADEDYEVVPCNNFEDVLSVFIENNFKTYPRFESTMAGIFACIVMTDVPGDQLWLRIISPPGAGKTMCLETVSTCKKYVYPRTEVTGFNSGMRSNGDEEANLITKMDHKTLIIEDADAIISSPACAKIFGEMRVFFNGTARAEYRNHVSSIQEDLRITVILGGTDILKGYNKSFLGERFMDFDLLGHNYDALSMVKSAIERARSKDSALSKEGHKKIKATCAGFIHYLRDNVPNELPQINDAQAEWIAYAATYVAQLRAKQFMEGGSPDVRTRAEIGTRLGGQITRLIQGLCLVFRIEEPDLRVGRIVRQCVKDTAGGYTQEILDQVAKDKNVGTRLDTISDSIVKSKSSIQKLLSSMEEFFILQKESRRSKTNRGQRVPVWTMTTEMTEIYNAVQDLTAFGAKKKLVSGRVVATKKKVRKNRFKDSKTRKKKVRRRVVKKSKSGDESLIFKISDGIKKRIARA